MADPDAHALISAARDLTRGTDERTAGFWPRASALLARQAIEMAMAQLWPLVAPGMGGVSTRCQLLCLGPLLGDEALGGRVSSTWSALSNACHVRLYELPPTASDLGAWLEVAWELAEAVERRRSRVGSGGRA